MSGGPSILFYEPIPAGVRIAQCAGITLTGYLLGKLIAYVPYNTSKGCQ